MKTPIADFVKKYADSDCSRFHMPGHKGKSFLGFEKYDITEIWGADVLSSAEGIILESENNASLLFKTAHTYYSTQGSTAAICAMLALVNDGKRPLVLAARNVHRAFIHACALLDFEPLWMLPEKCSSIMECIVTGKMVEEHILSAARKPAAVYLTSPDYLGNLQNIPDIAKVCKKHEIPLLIDNAHGAYLGFLKESLHPIHLGATACCDSAHKTLPVLTGGAYLHISKNAPGCFLEKARAALTLFSSTSPSYLVLQSLDLCNCYIADKLKNELEECTQKVSLLKGEITELGFCVKESEPLKITIDAYASGYTGNGLADFLRKNNAEVEFYDNEYVVMMLSPQNTEKDFEVLKHAFSQLTLKKSILGEKVDFILPEIKMSVREAVLSDSETLDVRSCVGRICATPTVSCPPAVPIAVSGETITDEIIKLFIHYGIDKIQVVKECNVHNA